MFGVEKRVERVRRAIITGLRTKSAKIMMPHANTPPAGVPRHDLARAMVLLDIAEILETLALAPEEGGH